MWLNLGQEYIWGQPRGLSACDGAQTSIRPFPLPARCHAENNGWVSFICGYEGQTQGQNLLPVCTTSQRNSGQRVLLPWPGPSSEGSAPNMDSRFISCSAILNRITSSYIQRGAALLNFALLVVWGSDPGQLCFCNWEVERERERAVLPFLFDTEQLLCLYIPFKVWLSRLGQLELFTFESPLAGDVQRECYNLTGML